MLNTAGFSFSPGSPQATDLADVVQPPQFRFVDGRSLVADDSAGINNWEKGRLTGVDALAHGITVAATDFATGMEKAKSNEIESKKYNAQMALAGMKISARSDMQAATLAERHARDQAEAETRALTNQVLKNKLAKGTDPYATDDAPISVDDTPPAPDQSGALAATPPPPSAAPVTNALMNPIDTAPMIQPDAVPGVSSLGQTPVISAPPDTNIVGPPAATPTPEGALPTGGEAPQPLVPDVSALAAPKAGKTQFETRPLPDGNGGFIPGKAIFIDHVKGTATPIDLPVNPSSVAVPDGQHLKSTTVGPKGQVSQTYESDDAVQARQDAAEEKKTAADARMSQAQQRSVRQEQSAFYNTPTIKIFEGQNGVRQALPRFFADYNDAQAHPDQAGIHDVGMLDMYAKAEAGGRVTVQQAELALQAKNLSDKFQILFSKPMGGDVLSPGQRDSMLRVVAENYNAGANLANQNVGAARDRLMAQGVTDEKMLPQPYALVETKETAVDKINQLRKTALATAETLKAAQAAGDQGAVDAGRKSLKEITDQATKLGGMLKNGKGLILNMDDISKQKQGFGGGSQGTVISTDGE